jgi:hypothetical protein
MRVVMGGFAIRRVVIAGIVGLVVNVVASLLH